MARTRATKKRSSRRKQKHGKRTTMSFRRSKVPPRRKDVVKGGSYGATAFPVSSPAMATTYNQNPSSLGISTSNSADIITGVNPSQYPPNVIGLKGGKKKQRGGGSLHNLLFNSVNSISSGFDNGVTHSGIHHPPLITDVGGMSKFANGVLNGPQVSSLTNTNPPLA